MTLWPPLLCALLGLVDYKVITAFRHNPVQIPEWIAVVADVLAIIDLQELAWCTVLVLCRPDVILAHAVVCALVSAHNGWLGAGQGMNEVDSFHFDV